MPSRILRDRYAESDTIASLPDGPQDRFPRYTLIADDYGCFRFDPVVIKGRIWIKRPTINVPEIVDDLCYYESRRLLIGWHDPDDERVLYCFFRGWFASQNRPRGLSKRKTPPPPEIEETEQIRHFCNWQQESPRSRSRSRSRTEETYAPDKPARDPDVPLEPDPQTAPGAQGEVFPDLFATEAEPSQGKPPEAKPGPPAKAPAPTHEVRDHWCVAWFARKAKPYTFVAADYGQAKKLSTQLGLPELFARIDRALSTPWFLQSGDFRSFVRHHEKFATPATSAANGGLREVIGYTPDGGKIYA